ncbi:hypothetical protein AAF712_015113 [Marasmius tenuissimus]|uniref:Uncharacterized protein n=1 Tax=Marasmius tenuissimus TaxID=585030 RepID=A0ABR2Z960_9AGAR
MATSTQVNRDQLDSITQSLQFLGQPCNVEGKYLPLGSTPLPAETEGFNLEDYSPFGDRFEFELGDFLFREAQMSGAKIQRLMQLWAVRSAGSGEPSPFRNQHDLYDHIDGIQYGDTPWKCFTARYRGEKPERDVPSWMEKEYDIWYRDPMAVFSNQLSHSDLDGESDYSPYQEFDEHGERNWRNLMSANWAWSQCDKIYEDDPSTAGAMFCPIVMGSDKTTVSVGTGQNEYYPLYGSLGGLHNNVRRAHRDGIHLLAFLAIPKGERQHDKDRNFQFRRQLFHSSIAAIFQSLKPAVTKPVVMRCPDGHFRRVIFGLGPYIADYPEQALLACVVQGWCPKCTAHPHELDDPNAFSRTRRWTDAMIEAHDGVLLWNAYGIVADVVPFTNYFPRADIHELLTPDLLHQIIKGAFKDHLVDWINQFILCTHGDKDGKKIIDDIDRRLAAVPQFPGLRRFPEGRRFSQWTGDDSKALMKVYLPALHGHLPPSILKCLSALLEFCYLVRRDFITESTLVKVQQALDDFHEHRERQNERDNKDDDDSGPLDTRDLTSTLTMALTPQRGYPSTFLGISAHIEVDHFPDLVRRYLFEHIYPNDERRADSLPIDECPPLWSDIDVDVFHSVTATFYAPTDPSGIAGMKREVIRATPSWRKGQRRYDCVFVEVDPEADGMRGLNVLRVRLFFSFEYRGKDHQCVLVEWFSTLEEEPDEDIGLWLVEPDIDNEHGCRDMQVIGIRTILRAAHLIPVFGPQFLPYKFHYSDSLDAFDLFWVNKYADHNSYDTCY